MSIWKKLFGGEAGSTPGASSPKQQTFEDLCASGTLKQVQQAIDAGTDVNLRSQHGGTPLMSAINNPDVGVIPLLVRAGAEVNAQTVKGQTALMIAAMGSSKPEVISALIRAGADPNLENINGWTALKWAAQTNPNPDIITALVAGGADATIPGLLEICESHNRNKDAVAAALKAAVPPSVEIEQEPPPAHMILVPAGIFAMGDTFAEGDYCDIPVHNVHVSEFLILSTLVTKAHWDRVHQWAVAHGYTFDNAGSGTGPHHPVQKVNWHDSVKWCNALSEMEGVTPCYYSSPDRTTVYRSGRHDLSNACVDWTSDGYRLPTEAEWEKAARGGLEGKRFPWGDTISHENANYNSDWIGSKPCYAYDINKSRGYHPTNRSGGTSVVGTLTPNPFGIYDLAGNVFERCWDWYEEKWYSDRRATEPDPRGPDQGEGRVVRGGSWHAPAKQARVACRWSGSTDKASDDRGFRYVRKTVRRQ